MSGIKLKGGAAAARAKPSTTRWALWLFLVLLLLLIVAYFIVISSPFVKRFVLPRVGDSLRAELTADSVRLNPFSKLELTNVKLTPRGEETLLTGGRLRVRYSLVAFWQGRMEVSELLVDSATLTLVEKPDGTSNLRPLLTATARKPTPKSAAATPTVVDVKSIQLTNVTVRRIKQHRGASPDQLEISQLNLTASDLRNSATGKVAFDTLLALEQSAVTNAGSSKLSSHLKGSFTFALDGDLKPTTLQGQTTFSVTAARGGFADLAGVAATLTADASPTQIKELTLGFTQGGGRLGGIHVSGPFAAAKREGKLNLEITAIDRRVLNLLGAAAGLDFGTTTINTTNEIELAKGGSVISIFGDLRIGQFQLVRAGQATPKLDLVGDYSVAVDQTKMSAVIGSLKLAGTQSGRSVLTAGLSGPMTITWGKAGDTVGASTFKFALTDVLFENWKPLLGDLMPAGKARLDGIISTKDDGKLVSYECQVNAESVSLLAGTQRIDGLTITLDAVGEARELKLFKVTEYGAAVFHVGQPAFSFQGAANYDRVTRALDADISVLGALPQLGGLWGAKSADISSGVLEIRGNAIQKPGTNLFTGKLRLVDLTGTLGTMPFEHFGTDLDLELAVDPKRLLIRKVAGAFSQSSKPGGKLNLTGTYALATGAADFALRLNDINQNGLRPFLEPYLGGKKLTTASLQATTAVSLTATGVKSCKADLSLTNLTATEVRTGKPTAPLSARFQFDATLNPTSVQLRQCLLTLTPTDKAKNQIALTATVDFAKSNAITGSIKLAAESLDLTRAYDLVSSPAPVAGAAPPRPAATAPAAPEMESAPLPPMFDNLVAELTVDRFTIREVFIEKLSARAKLDGSRVLAKPCFLSLNGAPVKATLDLDLGVPGYHYDVTFEAQGVPIAPVINTFQPERRGQMAGKFTGLAAVKGEGITGANLQKHLSGEITTVMTNVNLSLANTRTPVIRTVLNTVVGIPDLIRNPVASVENLVGRLVNFGGQRGGWSDQLMTAPIEVIETKISVGAGRVRLEQAEVRSSAFKARAAGDIVLAAIFTNSTVKIPVAVSLNRPLANQIGLVPLNAPTNAVYYSMPQFLEIEGTLGKPESTTDKLALAELAARAGIGVAKGVGGVTGERVGGILQKGGDLLGGRSSTNAPASTNKPSGSFDLFR